MGKFHFPPFDVDDPDTAEETVREYAVSCLDSIEKPLSTLFEKLRPYVEDDAYGAIVADDTSARIPAIILRYAINALRAEQGLPKIPLYFVAGAGGTHYSWLLPFRAQIRARKDALARQTEGGLKAVLFVTDYISTGSTMKNFVEELTTMGIPIHAAAVFAHPKWEKYSGIYAKGMPEEILVGESRHDTSSAIDGNYMISGVRRQSPPGETPFVSVEKSVAIARNAARLHAAELGMKLARTVD